MVFGGLKLESLVSCFWALGYAFRAFWLYRHAYLLFQLQSMPFNMVDGIDGLLGGLSCVSFGVLGIFTLPKVKLCTCVLVLLIYCRDFTLYHVKVLGVL